jgi:hypothetical protein
MPTPTYIALANITLTSAVGNVTFSSIPSTYRDLVLVMNGTSSTGNPFAFLRFNGDSGSNYNYVFMYGDGGGAAVSTTFSGQTTGFIGNIDTGARNTVITQIMDYSASDRHKTMLARSSGGLEIATAIRWANTSAVTSMSVNVNTGAFSSGFTFALYGIVS